VDFGRVTFPNRRGNLGVLPGVLRHEKGKQPMTTATSNDNRAAAMKAIEQLDALGDFLLLRVGEHAVFVPLHAGQEIPFQLSELSSLGFDSPGEAVRWLQQHCGLAVAACLSPEQLAKARELAAQGAIAGA
jgi:hypothetical protein